MLFDLISTGDIRITIISILLTIPSVIISLTFHEVAHGFVAYKMGDPTARSLGRLSLNPVKHLDLFGTLSMLIIGFGWAKPVPINTRYFKKQRLGMALTALAGPVMNLLLAFVGVFIWAILVKFVGTATTIAYAAVIFFQFFFEINIVLAVFNMIPVPPFDGSRVLFVFLPDKIYFGIMKYERYIMLAVLVLFATGIFSIAPLAGLIENAMLKLVVKIFF